MDKALLEQAKKLAARNYLLSIFEDKLSNGTIKYMAKNPELKGCMAQGSSSEDAKNNLDEARVDYIYDSLEDGVPVPEPAVQPIPRINKTVETSDSQTIISVSISFKRTLQDAAQPSQRTPLYEAWIST